MAFEGDLTNLGLADIFQTLSMNRQSGTLVVRYGETERRFHFTDDGVSLLTSRSARRFRLGNLLVGMGKLSDGDLRVAVLKQERAKDAKLGDILVQTGLVKQEDISEACRYQAAEEIYDSFNWKSGKFQFLEGANAGPSGGPGPFAEFFFNVTDVVMEAARRMDEFSLTLQRIGDQQEFFIRVDGAKPDPEKVGRPALALLETLDGTSAVTQVFEEFYLSPFDTAQAFVALLDNSLIRPTTPDELEAGAAPFLERKDFAPAARMLARAVHGRPQDAGLLKRLADAESAAGSRKEASVTLARLGELHRTEGRSIEATEALRAAVEQDSRNETAYEQLMDVYVALEQMDRAEDACREAARLLSDDRNFDGSLRLLDRGLASMPESVGLRIQRGNALLALGRREEGMAEMDAAAQTLEARKDRGQLLLGVYRKLLQLDPDRKDLKDRIDAILAGEKARIQRKKFLRIGAAAAGVAALMLAYMFRPLSASEKLDRAEAIIKADGAMDEAEALVAEVLRGAEEGSEDRLNADTLLQQLVTRKQAPERAKRVAAFKKVIEDEYANPAAALSEQMKLAEAIQKNLQAYERVKGPESDPLRGVKDFEDLLKWSQEQVRSSVRASKTMLLRELADIQATMTNVEAVKLDRADDARKRDVYAATTKALAMKGRVDWPATLLALQNAEEVVGATEGVRLTDLASSVEDLDQYYKTLDTTHKQASAMVQGIELQEGFRLTLEEVAAAKGRGDLDGAVRQCQEFLDRCAAFRAGEPREFFAPLVETVLEAPGRERRIRETMKSLEGTRSGITRAEELRKAGRLQEAFDLLRKTLLEAQDIDLRVTVELPVRVTTTPPGATVTVTRPELKPIKVGVADPSREFTYPYTGVTEVRLELAGFEPHVIRLKGLPADTTAVLAVHLQRNLRWQKDAGAAVESTPAIVGKSVVVASRAGVVRVFALDSGDEAFQLDTKHASGVRGGIVSDGSRAYFAGADGEAFALDVAARKFAWQVRLPSSAATRPALVGDLVVFADEQGHLVALRRADGSPAWSLTLGSAAMSRPVSIAGSVLLGLADGALVCVGGDGKERWRRPLSGPALAPPTADGDGGVLAGTDAGTLERLSLADGSVRWVADLGGNSHVAPALRPDGIRVLTTQGTVVRVSLAEGKVLGSTSVGVGTDGGALEAGGVLYAGSSSGSLVAYDLALDRVRWVYSATGPIKASPAAVEGFLIVALADGAGRVLALEP